jgi:hypothetical protein
MIKAAQVKLLGSFMRTIDKIFGWFIQSVIMKVYLERKRTSQVKIVQYRQTNTSYTPSAISGT